MVGAPMRAAGARILAGTPALVAHGRAQLAIPMAMGLAILGAFTQYAHPIVDTWAAAIPE